jgi:predicted TIM-barrel fold metal-dependent hydrolase
MADVEVFDAHFHIIDPRFPLVPNQGYLPEPFSGDQYLSRMADFRLCGGAVVSASFQAFDQSYLLDALERLGPSFVGVTQLPGSAPDEEVIRLDRAGVRALRFNLKRGGSEDVSALDRMARRVHDLAGWHVELYTDAAALEALLPRLLSLPAVSIDHLGLSRAALPLLLRLAESGGRVKATGFGRMDLDVSGTLKQLHAANPAALMFGTDLPSTRARRPYRDRDLDRIVESLGEEGARRVCRDNAIEFYRPRSASPAAAQLARERE